MMAEVIEGAEFDYDWRWMCACVRRGGDGTIREVRDHSRTVLRCDHCGEYRDAFDLRAGLFFVNAPHDAGHEHEGLHPDELKQCGKADDRDGPGIHLQCTRKAGHSGWHVAHGSDEAEIKRWAQRDTERTA